MKGRQITAYFTLAAGILLVVMGLWIQVKAVIAQMLLHSAWAISMASGEEVRPWPWADYWPVAEIRFVDQKESFVVLNGDEGAALAFAPGMSRQGALPHERGVKVISAHRDTHFRILRHAAIDQAVELVDRRGNLSQYQIHTIQVVDTTTDQLVISPEEDGKLLLVTCYPFDAVSSGVPLRLVVEALKV